VKTAEPLVDSVRSLYERLEQAGLDRKFVRKVLLPDWWDDAIAQHPTGYAEARLRIARALGLSLRQLDSEDPLREMLSETRLRCKTRRDTELDSIHWTIALAKRAAELAARATPKPYEPLPETASQIRDAILQEHQWVSLDNLLVYCWQHGIPVIPLKAKPHTSKKVDGQIVRVGERPVIVLACGYRYSARLLFIVAHELGHWVRGHLSNQPIFAEEFIVREAENHEEAEANWFAVELLTGKPDKAYWAPRFLTASQLAQGAQKAGARDRVDPGVVALNYAWNEGNWAAGIGALKLLEPQPKGAQVIQYQMRASLDWSRLHEEEARLLLRLTGGLPSVGQFVGH
jgi:Zn-dependent peptidase ImmA (M78 family)